MRLERGIMNRMKSARAEVQLRAIEEEKKVSKRQGWKPTAPSEDLSCIWRFVEMSTDAIWQDADMFVRYWPVKVHLLITI